MADDIEKERIRQNTDDIRTMRSDISETIKLVQSLDSKISSYIGTLTRIEEQHATIEKLEANIGALSSLHGMVEHFKDITLATETATEKIKDNIHALTIKMTRMESTMENVIGSSITQQGELLNKHSTVIDEHTSVINGMKGIKMLFTIVALVLGIIMYATRITSSSREQNEAMNTLVDTVQNNSELLSTLVDTIQKEKK